MQIMNNPNIPSSKQASFGMALKITKPAMDALEKSSMETINKLAKIGEDLADTKYYHLEIGKDLKPRIDSIYANSYVGEFKPIQPNDELLSIKTYWDGTEIPGVKKGAEYRPIIKFANKEAALAAYSKLNSLNNDIDRAAALTKMFDERTIEREAEKSAAHAEKLQVKEAASKLMEKFGGEAHIK